MEHTFDTPTPIELYVAIGGGSVTLTGTDTTTTHVRVSGAGAEEATVEQHGRQVAVTAPRRSGFLGGRDQDLRVEIELPNGSDLRTKTGSASQRATGRYATVSASSGAGDITIEALDDQSLVETGSGTISVSEAVADLSIKSGSGAVALGRMGGSLVVSTGSGSITIDRAEASVRTKTGSGNVVVNRAEADLAASSGSGDLTVDLFVAGGLVARCASGDVRVGVPSGIPVWTDISTVTGRLESGLEGAGQPRAGEPHLELRVTTVSGDVVLHQR